MKNNVYDVGDVRRNFYQIKLKKMTSKIKI